jgi:hypothetical protein
MLPEEKSTAPLSQPFRRAARWLTAAVLVLAGGFLLWSAFGNRRQVFAPAPVSLAHAFIGTDCQHCHAGEPAGGRPGGAVPDRACLRCHDGSAHHEDQIRADVPGCAGCHREHEGRSHLAQVADSFCTRCHANLTTTSGPSARFHRRVIDFRSHPEFAVLEHRLPDTAEIRFNHALHLKPEGVLGLKRERIHLECSACHQPDASRRYMKPINYQAHCAECHGNALAFDTEPRLNRLAPHREPEIVLGVVRERYTQFVQQHPEIVAEDRGAAPERPLPGRPIRQPVTETQWAWVNQRLQRAERVLFEGAGGCRYCHRVEAGKDMWRVLPTNIPERWLRHSTFRHDSHRMLGCTECHAARTSAKTSDVLLPSVQSCTQCHHSEGGARDTCVECHLYHDRTKERGFNGPLPLGRTRWLPGGNSDGR